MGVSFPSLRVSKPLEILKKEFDDKKDPQNYIGELLVEFYKYVNTNPIECRVNGLLTKINSLFLYAEEKDVNLTNQRRVYLGLLQEFNLRRDRIKILDGRNGE